LNKVLLVVRHGETAESRNQTIQGQADTVLTSRGIKQAEALGHYLAAKHDISQLICSDLLRARQTADAVLAVMNGKVRIETEPSLREISCGKLEGMPLELLLKKRAECPLGAENYAPINGESLSDLRTRVWNWVRSLTSGLTGEILVITHRGPISMILEYASPILQNKQMRFAMEHNTISVFDFRCAGSVELRGFERVPEIGSRADVQRD